MSTSRFAMHHHTVRYAPGRALAALGLLLAVTLAGLPWPHASAATLGFYNGVIGNIGTDINCITQNGEIREQAYDGFTLRNQKLPGVGEVWYAHVVISHPGDPCSGGSYTGIEVLLPPSTTFAISSANPVFCAVRNNANQVTVYYRQNQGCPQAPSTGLEGYAFWAYSGSQAQPWPIAFGTFLELMIPLRSSAPLTAQTLRFRINPDVGVVGYVDVGTYVTHDELFRSDFDNDTIVPDICAIGGTVSCVLAP